MTFDTNGKCIGRTYKLNNTLDAAMLDSLLWDVLDMMGRGDGYSAKMAWDAFNLPHLPACGNGCGNILDQSDDCEFCPMHPAEIARVNERNLRAAQHTAYARRVARAD
jgi:hypothetical protein